jgi:hypothetical protein
MAFGRKDTRCPRCRELLAGAPARAGWQRDYYRQHAEQARIERLAFEAHFAPDGPHARGECGPICTAFDW